MAQVVAVAFWAGSGKLLRAAAAAWLLPTLEWLRVRECTSFVEIITNQRYAVFLVNSCVYLFRSVL